MTLVVRQAERSDAERLARINIDAWRSAYTGIVSQAMLDGMRLEEYVERWERIITENAPVPGGTVLLAEFDGVVATYCAGGPYRAQEDAAQEDTANWGEVYAIYTDPDLQRHGAGIAVHDAFLDGLRQGGFQTAVLWVLEVNRPARKWYGRRGWRPDGAVADWTSNGLAHPELRLRLELRDAEPPAT